MTCLNFLSNDFLDGWNLRLHVYSTKHKGRVLSQNRQICSFQMRKSLKFSKMRKPVKKNHFCFFYPQTLLKRQKISFKSCNVRKEFQTAGSKLKLFSPPVLIRMLKKSYILRLSYCKLAMLATFKLSSLH